MMIKMQAKSLEMNTSSNWEVHNNSLEKTESNENCSSSGGGARAARPAPEKKLTLFALRLAVLEKAASGLGTLGFIWATVVLLGGFAITLGKTDFWFITTILLIEGARIFSRSHELEWQHQATWSLADVGRMSFKALKSSSFCISRAFKRPQRLPMTREEADVGTTSTHNPSSPRTWLTPEVPLLPYTGWLFLSKNISKLLYWLQLLSATACVTLSLMRLIQQDYGEVSKGDFDKRNRKSALNIFYGLALAEALLFLLERTYWEYKVSHCKLLEEVNRECDLGRSGLVTIKRFFYDAYSRCVNGSIFDGLTMDLVSFGAELMESSFCDEQLSGARVIRRFATDSRFKDDTLRKIGSSMPTVERLVEMLYWKKPEEEEIRMAAGEILSNLAGKKQNSLRVACIPGAMEAISSLLYAPDQDNYGEANYEYSAFNLMGLLILKKLARDVGNCEKIGSTRGLLPEIIQFTQTGQLVKNKHVTKSQISAVKRSLKLVKMLVGTAGSTGKNLRREISEIVFTISNIREMIQYGESYPGLQKLGMEILTRLALDEEAKEKVGRTGGLLGILLSIFVGDGLIECHKEEGVRNAAGEAVAMLAMESLNNCSRVLRLNALEKLVGCLEHPSLRVNAARVMRNLCAYSGEHHLFLLKGLTSATNTVSIFPNTSNASAMHLVVFMLTYFLFFCR